MPLRSNPEWIYSVTPHAVNLRCRLSMSIGRMRVPRRSVRLNRCARILLCDTSPLCCILQTGPDARGLSLCCRHAAMRRAAGDAFPARSLVTVFVLRGVVLWIVALPVQLAMSPGEPGLGPLAVIGVVLWGIGLFLETVSGAQLTRFTAEPANDGAILRAGLWQAPLRPDHVGTLGAWWGIFLVAAETSDARIGVIGPILLSILLVRAVDGLRQLDVGMRADQSEYGES